MTDKQIIIDGVDVSGCKKYEHEIVRCNATLKNMCFCGGRCTDKKNADCYFKQLKRKEQECNKYKQTLTEIEEIAMCIMDDDLEESSAYYNAKQILQKISEHNVENKYDTKDIRHINENNQEYIAEGNRMTKKFKEI